MIQVVPPITYYPYISKVAVGNLSELVVYGNNYPSHDGAGVRDYIHVIDLAEGHVCAIKVLPNFTAVDVSSLDTGEGHSVPDMVRAFELVSG